VTRYVWVTARKAEGFPIAASCDAAGVSRQAFYDWKRCLDNEPTARELEDALVVGEMFEIVKAFNGTYGEPRMTMELRARGFVVNKKRVVRLMRVNNMVGVHKPTKKRTTIPSEDNPPIPDLVKRQFQPGIPDKIWVSDITYIATGQSWLYLATVIDLGSRKVLGYSMANHMRTDLVSDALKMAIAARGGVVAGIVFHSDRGSQYTSGEFGLLLGSYQMLQSVGRTGVCYDNAVAESFFGSLKRELVDRYQYPTHAKARSSIFAWIVLYNTRRLHSTLGYVPPDEWENKYNQHTTYKAA
jgi:putative transposase